MKPTPLMIAVDARLTKWRKRDLRVNHWSALPHYGINAVRQGLGEKDEVREALLALVECGRVRRWECSSGVLWQGGFRDRIDVGREAVEIAARTGRPYGGR